MQLQFERHRANPAPAKNVVSLYATVLPRIFLSPLSRLYQRIYVYKRKSQKMDNFLFYFSLLLLLHNAIRPNSTTFVLLRSPPSCSFRFYRASKFYESQDRIYSPSLLCKETWPLSATLHIHTTVHAKENLPPWSDVTRLWLIYTTVLRIQMY